MISNKEKNEFVKNIRLTRRDATISSLIEMKEEGKSIHIWKDRENEESINSSKENQCVDMNIDLCTILPFLDDEKISDKKKFIKGISEIYIENIHKHKYKDACPLGILYNLSLVSLSALLKCPVCGLATPDFLTICPYCGEHF